MAVIPHIPGQVAVDINTVNLGHTTGLSKCHLDFYRLSPDRHLPESLRTVTEPYSLTDMKVRITHALGGSMEKEDAPLVFAPTEKTLLQVVGWSDELLRALDPNYRELQTFLSKFEEARRRYRFYSDPTEIPHPLEGPDGTEFILTESRIKSLLAHKPEIALLNEGMKQIYANVQSGEGELTRGYSNLGSNWSNNWGTEHSIIITPPPSILDGARGRYEGGLGHVFRK